ncbi:unnamed protein product [Debaryomyces fabryi]|nr:unnamed protein product [Debaryomyces fabryi]
MPPHSGKLASTTTDGDVLNYIMAEKKIGIREATNGYSESECLLCLLLQISQCTSMVTGISLITRGTLVFPCRIL